MQGVQRLDRCAGSYGSRITKARCRTRRKIRCSRGSTVRCRGRPLRDHAIGFWFASAELVDRRKESKKWKTQPSMSSQSRRVAANAARSPNSSALCLILPRVEIFACTNASAAAKLGPRTRPSAASLVPSNFAGAMSLSHRADADDAALMMLRRYCNGSHARWGRGSSCSKTAPRSRKSNQPRSFSQM
jgi:hypothetical protein